MNQELKAKIAAAEAALDKHTDTIPTAATAKEWKKEVNRLTAEVERLKRQDAGRKPSILERIDAEIEAESEDEDE